MTDKDTGVKLFNIGLSFSLFLALFCSINFASIRAQASEPITAARYSQIQAESILRVLSIIGLSTAGQNQLTPTAALSSISDEELSVKLQSQTLSYFNIYLQDLDTLTPSERVFLKEYIKQERPRFWKALSKSLRETWSTLALNVRLKGTVTAIAYGAGFAFELLLDYFMIQIGRPEIISIISLIPIPTIFASIESGVERYFLRRKVDAAFGPSEEFEAYEKSRKKIRKDFLLKNEKDLLSFIGTENGSLAVRIAEEKVASSLLDRFKMLPKTLNYSRLRQFCIDRKIALEWIASIEQTTALTDIQRATLLVHHIFQTTERATQTELILQFEKNFRWVNGLQISTEVTEIASQWVIGLTKTKKVSLFLEKALSAPTGLNAEVIASIWRQLLIPHLASLDISAATLRKIIHEYSVDVEPFLLRDPTSVDTLKISQKLYTFLEKHRAAAEPCSRNFDSLRGWGEEFIGNF